MKRLTSAQQKLVLRYHEACQAVTDAERARFEAWDQLLRSVTPDQMVAVERARSLVAAGAVKKSEG